MPTDELPAVPVPADAPFPYMRWAKAHLGPEDLSLGLSGLRALPAAARRELGLSVPQEVGDPEAVLKRAVASRYGVEAARVFPAAGSSHANFAVFHALARGRHVVVEEPAYEALPRLAAAVSATVSTVRREARRGWRLDREGLRAAVRPDTALLAVTDLHNPSGKRLHDEDLDALIEAAAAVGAHVLVDEVYADFDPLERPTAARRDDRVLVTNSLTKAHGLPDLRAGWVLAAPALVAALEGWGDLVHPVLPPAPLLEAAAYLPHAGACLARTRVEAAARRAQVAAWVARTPGVAWVEPDAGITGFLLLPDAHDGDLVAARLHERHGVRVVPGSFFQVRNALRISFLLDEADLARALDALADVLVATGPGTPS